MITIIITLPSRGIITMADPGKFKGRELFSKMGTKNLEIFVCRAYADISDLIVRKQLSPPSQCLTR